MTKIKKTTVGDQRGARIAPHNSWVVFDLRIAAHFNSSPLAHIRSNLGNRWPPSQPCFSNDFLLGGLALPTSLAYGACGSNFVDCHRDSMDHPHTSRPWTALVWCALQPAQFPLRYDSRLRRDQVTQTIGRIIPSIPTS